MPSDDDLRRIYAETRTIAVVGASSDPAKEAHRIPRYLQSRGYRIIPVTPRRGDVLGEPTFSSLLDVDVAIDVVNVFRPEEEVPGIAREAEEKGAKVLWTQTGIESQEGAELARSAGMIVVMGICIKQTHQRLNLGDRSG